MENHVSAGVGDSTYFTDWYADRDGSYYRPILSHVVRHGRPGPLLDLGAGTGLLVECAARFGFDATGLEASPEAIAVAHRRDPSLKIRHHTLPDPLPLEEASVETVVMNQVIEHLRPEVGEFALAEAWRVLIPGGMIYVASPCRHNRKERDADPTHQHLYTPSELRHLLSRLGFANVTGMDAPFAWPGCRWLWDRLGRPDRLSASATCRGNKPLIHV